MTALRKVAPAADPVSSPFPGSAATPIGAPRFNETDMDRPGCRPTGEAGAPNLSNPFQFRTEDCPDCDRATTIRCDTCWSSGETDAACVVCRNIKALDDDGFCSDCLKPSDGSSWLRAETSALNMGRAQ